MKLSKGDFAVFIIVISVALLLYFALNSNSRSANTVLIYEKGTLVAAKNLSENTEIKLAGNIIEIKDGYVFMKEADCKDKLCVKHQPINKAGSIICLPNRVVVEIKGLADVDVIVGGNQ